MEEVEERIKLQNYIDSLLTKGILFAILWAAGVGSFIALKNGIEVYNLIRQHAPAYQLTGNGRSIFCIGAGIIGLLFWIPLIFWGFLSS